MKTFDGEIGVPKKFRGIGRLRLYSILLLIAIIFVVSIVICIIGTFNDKQYTITVTCKERITESATDIDGKTEVTSKYLVFGDDEDGESLVFENTDVWLRGKTNSSNIQGQLKEGHKYTITVVGFRISLMDCYENIIKVEEK